MSTDTPVMSDLVSAFERAWHEIMSNHPEVPDVVLVVAPAEKRGGKLGHFAAGSWRTRVNGESAHEVLLVAEHLDREPADVMLTLIHEAAHALAATRGIKDTSRGGRYHNRRFVAVAQELGLNEPTYVHPTFGHAFVTLGDDAAGLYSAAIAELGEAIDAYRASRPADSETDGDTKSTSGRQHAVCECWPPRRLPVSRRTLEQAPIICGACNHPFEFPVEDDGDA
jgi:hypothetical protein